MTSRTIDVKLLFTIFMCEPDRKKYDDFECDLFAHGGRTDSEGWSWSDCLRRIDEGAVDAAGNPMPGVPPLPAGAGVAARAAQSARRSRLKSRTRT